MFQLCRTEMALPPHLHIGLYLLKNIPSLSFLKELFDNNYSVKHLISKRKVGNCEALNGLLCLSPMNLHLMKSKLQTTKFHVIYCFIRL